METVYVNTTTLSETNCNIFVAKKMKKKKIVFSSSGGTPAMQFLLYLIESFGNSNIENIAKMIAATCNKNNVTATVVGNRVEFIGDGTGSVKELDGTIVFAATNIKVENNTLIIVKQ